MDRTELAWAAGFWDGEGSVYLSGALDRSRQYPQARINQASFSGVPAVLFRFQQAVGFGVISGPELKAGREPLYRWVVSSRREVNSVVTLLAPWLGPVKLRQFVDVLGTPVNAAHVETFPLDEQRAWAAGLFDGEGSVYLAKHGTHPGYFRLEAAVTQSSGNGMPDVLERFMRIVGVGKIGGPYPVQKGWQPVYRWKAHRRDQIEGIVALLRPALGPVKIEQAFAAMSVVARQAPLLRGNPAWGNRKSHCVNGHEYATTRIRPFRGRGVSSDAPRPSKQCLACLREHAARKREERAKRRKGRRGMSA